MNFFNRSNKNITITYDFYSYETKTTKTFVFRFDLKKIYEYWYCDLLQEDDKKNYYITVPYINYEDKYYNINSFEFKPNSEIIITNKTNELNFQIKLFNSLKSWEFFENVKELYKKLVKNAKPAVITGLGSFIELENNYNNYLNTLDINSLSFNRLDIKLPYTYCLIKNKLDTEYKSDNVYNFNYYLLDLYDINTNSTNEYFNSVLFKCIKF